MTRLQDVILRGLAAARPLANAVPNGTLYYSTDTAITELSDGATWLDYSDGGSGWLSTYVFSRGVNLSGIITTGIKGTISIPVDCTIIGWTIMSDTSMDIEFDIKSDATFPPTTSIVAAAPPELVAQDTNADTTLTGWTVDIDATWFMEFSVTTVVGVPGYLVLQLDLVSR